MTKNSAAVLSKSSERKKFFQPTFSSTLLNILTRTPNRSIFAGHQKIAGTTPTKRTKTSCKMIASTVSNNNKLARPLPQVLADAAAAAVKAAAAAAKSGQDCDAAPSSSSSAASREVQQMENDRRRKIAAKCLELEEMLESKGYK